jgi:hypothetical protein
VTGERSSEWLALLEAELARRAARTEWEAGAGERAREALTAELLAMAQRMATTAHLYPLSTDDMSIAEMLAARMLPKHLQPPGLPSEAKIWAQYRARKKG